MLGVHLGSVSAAFCICWNTPHASCHLPMLAQADISALHTVGDRLAGWVHRSLAGGSSVTVRLAAQLLWQCRVVSTDWPGWHRPLVRALQAVRFWLCESDHWLPAAGGSPDHCSLLMARPGQ